MRKEVLASVGKRKAEWGAEMRKYKRWKEDPYGMLTKDLYASKRQQDGSRRLKRKIERQGAENYVNKLKTACPALEDLIEGALQKLCGPPLTGGTSGNKVPNASDPPESHLV